MRIVSRMAAHCAERAAEAAVLLDDAPDGRVSPGTEPAIEAHGVTILEVAR